MLNGKLQLHDITDVESFVNAYLHKATRRYPLGQRHEDALAYLIAELWKASQHYNPTLGLTFERYARAKLKHFLIQWFRSTLIDHRYRHRYSEADWLQAESVRSPRSLDEKVSGYTTASPVGEVESDKSLHFFLPAPDPLKDELEHALAASRGDPTTDSDPALVGILAKRSSSATRDLAIIREHLKATPRRRTRRPAA